MRALVAGTVLAVATTATSPARAEDSTAHELRYNLTYDIAVIAGSFALVLGTEYFRAIKPKTCRWCDRDDGQDHLNGLDRWARNSFRWKEPRDAQFDSGVISFLIQPAAATLEMIAVSTNDDAGRAFPVDFLIISEAVAVSTLLNQTTKIILARERPFVHAMSDDDRKKTALPSDNNVSFYSGHTALGFTLASAAGTVASLRGYSLAPLVWGTLMPLAAAGGYLRIAADKHYFVDVMTGALIGTAVGVLLPVLFHGHDGDNFVPNGTGTSTNTNVSGSPLRLATPQTVTLSGGF